MSEYTLATIAQRTVEHCTLRGSTYIRTVASTTELGLERMKKELARESCVSVLTATAPDPTIRDSMMCGRGSTSSSAHPLRAGPSTEASELRGRSFDPALGGHSNYFTAVIIQRS